MRSSDDQSLFAWGLTTQEYDLLHSSNEKTPSTLRGFLARSPAAFEHSRNVVPYRNWEVSRPYSMTNQGLCMELPVIQHDNFKEYTAILACHYEDNYLGPLGILHLASSICKWRPVCKDVWYVNPVLVVPQHAAQAKVRRIYIRQEVLLPTVNDLDRTDHFLIRTMPDNPDDDTSSRKCFPPNTGTPLRRLSVHRIMDGADMGHCCLRKRVTPQKCSRYSSDHKFDIKKR